LRRVAEENVKQKEAKFMDKWGYNPRQLYAQGVPVWSIWFHVTDPKWVPWVHTGLVVILFLFLIGFCTRVTSVLAWLTTVSYVQRSQVSVFGLDTMINLTLIYLMIGPSGAALSVDRLIVRYWTSRRLLRRRRKGAGAGSAIAQQLAEDPILQGRAPRVSAT